MLAHFNTSYVVIKLELSTPLLKCFTISIHLMLLLNTGASVKLDLSTGDFNTSYVVIKPLVNKPFYTFYYTSKPISINTFLLFYQMILLFYNC